MSPVLKKLAGLACVVFVVLVVGGLVLANANNGAVLILLGERVALVAFAAALGAAGVSFGMAILWVLRVAPERRLSFLLAAAGVGLGAFALVFLLLGVLGIMTRPVWIVALLVGAGLGAPVWIKLSRMDREPPRGRFGVVEAIFAALGAFVLLWLLLVAFHPPLDYDVQEYHLGAPATWLRMGQVAFLPNNVYSNFPMNAEMLFEAGLVLLDARPGAMDLYTGSYGAIAIVILFTVLTALALYDIGTRLGGTLAGVFAATFFLTCRWVFELSCKAYVEMPLVFFGLLAADRVFRAVFEDGPDRTRRHVLVGGLLVGFAMGIKYTAWPYFALPLGLVLLAAAIGGKIRLRHVVFFAVAAAVVVSPWLVRNFVNTGNPIFPMLAGTLGAHHWSSAQVARWNAAHAPGEVSLPWLKARFVESFFADDRLSPLMYLFAPVALFFSPRRRVLGAYVGLGLFIFLVWFYFTHHMPRFLVPGMTLLCVASGVGCALVARMRRGAFVALPIAAAFILYSFVYIHLAQIELNARVFQGSRPAVDLGAPRMFERAMFPYIGVFGEERERCSRESRMLYLGEAKFFYMGPHARAYTVFDRNAIDEIIAGGKTADEAIVHELKSHGFRYIFVNWPEISRFNVNYAFEHEGRKHPGYSENVSRELFDRWIDQGLIAPMGRPPGTSTEPFELYVIR